MTYGGGGDDADATGDESYSDRRWHASGAAAPAPETSPRPRAMIPTVERVPIPYLRVPQVRPKGERGD